MTVNVEAAKPLPRPRTGGRRARGNRLMGAAQLVLPFLALLGVWQALTIVAPASILPSPTAVLLEGIEAARVGILPTFALRSLQALLVAAVVGTLSGIALGLLIAASRTLTKLLSAPISFLAATSEIAWLPMVLVWFGFTRRTVIYITIYTVLFPVMYSTVMGAQSIPGVYGRVMGTLGAGRWRTMLDVTIPGAMASIMTGTRLGIAYGWRTIIAAEIIVGASGLGFMIYRAQNVSNGARIIVGMIVIGTLWLLLDRNILRPIESATSERWGLVS